VRDSFLKLDPRVQIKNPVMFVVEVGSLLTTILWLRDRILHPAGAAPGWFTLTVSIWLWFTVVFANFAEAVAEAGAGGDDLVAAEDREEEIAAPAADGLRAHLHPGGDGGQTPVVHQVTLGRRGQRPEPPGP